VLIGPLTVFETVLFVARMRLPASTSKEKCQQIVEDIITEMGLDTVRSTYIGNWHIRGISGGQRRRVSIACELVTSPTLIFLDEPTSGLDAASAFYVMSAVKKLAKRCRTVCSVIHQVRI
jgi:ABC-type multidrug transport system ATPase subunit